MAGELQGIGSYRLLGVIGEGERAVVYRAVPGDGSDDDRPIAVKVIRTFLEDETAVAEDLKARVEVAKDLSHPNIESSLSYGEADGRPVENTRRAERERRRPERRRRRQRGQPPAHCGGTPMKLRTY